MTITLPHNLNCKTPWLKEVFFNFSSGHRLSNDDALRLLLLEDEKDQQALWSFADYIREQRVGNTVYFSSTLYLYPTNFCDFHCTFCSFYAKPGDPKGWLYSPDQLISMIREIESPITETHIVAGCFPSCNLDYYVELFTKIKSYFPHIHIKALTAIEYAYLAQLHNMPVVDILRILKDAGLDSIPGGGADILVDEVRQLLSPGRLSSDEFLSIHKTAHQLGIPSNSTMLCYHRERPEDLVTHMEKLRTIQDETYGFKNFILLKFATENNVLGKRLSKFDGRHSIPPASIIAVARLFLDNFKNIKALWNYLGIDEALKLLSCGANDFSSTHIGEKVFQMASSGQSIKMDIEGMENLIRQKGRIPCLTNSKNV
ncbi:radical SAM domain, CofH subfamily protein [Chlamydia ibidis]|uniref:Radical SAM domain, CofH subfamily protein n=2 Tax=Chlamydia ibidis TaxID=1405396 RepID=S7KLX5_9CHLA|nr:CofH family radical SAM protein [Chlamydia ibidis]EPP35445.1 radical SAM domain, CofH subfamily protein [Chlamydia ibidis]EQM62996.1 radical SAM domain, CofH subfamily protein [Chlamydia ibidis 10-1398/6]